MSKPAGKNSRFSKMLLPTTIMGLLAGMIQALIPTQTISKWIGMESGFRGLSIGTAVSGIMPGGPFTSFPIATALLRAGASIGTIVAFITEWSLWAIDRAAHRGRLNRLEIPANSYCLHLFLPANSRTDS